MARRAASWFRETLRRRVTGRERPLVPDIAAVPRRSARGGVRRRFQRGLHILGRRCRPRLPKVRALLRARAYCRRAERITVRVHPPRCLYSRFSGVVLSLCTSGRSFYIFFYFSFSRKEPGQPGVSESIYLSSFLVSLLCPRSHTQHSFYNCSPPLSSSLH